MRKRSEQQGFSQARKLTADAMVQLAHGIDKLGHLVGAAIPLPGIGARRAAAAPERPGDTPGIESIAGLGSRPAEGRVRVECFDYGPEQMESREIQDLEAFLGQARPAWSKVRWVKVDGLDPYTVDCLRRHFGFHTLAAEDVLRVPQRPKVEAYGNSLFVVLRMLRLEGDRLLDEQVSCFLFDDVLLTFQESEGDVWEPIRQRLLKQQNSRLRVNGAAYLLYALLDSVVDHCFPILESYGDLLESVERDIFERPAERVHQRLHTLKRELSVLRRVIWPMRDVITELQRDETGGFSGMVKTYLRDVYDHAVQVMDIVETHREMAAGLNDLYMSSVSNRMNEVMKVLTIMASFFIPLTFVAGIYGMNFEHIPELKWRYGYAGFWLACVVITGGLVVYFLRKGWIGRRG